MVWIKRNLVLVVSGLAGLLLAGFGTYLVMGGLARNKQLIDDVEATRTRANTIYEANPFPSQTNITTAKTETELLRGAIGRAHKHLAPLPVEKMDNIKQFMVRRDETLSELRNLAKQAGTELPASDYAFSFATQRGKTQFSPDTLPHVPEQMAEVKALCMILFEARVNRIGNIRRAKVSKDDKDSAFASDYTTTGVLDVMTDPTGQMINPYEVTFYSFTAEIADVLNRLDRSPHGLLVKAVQVEPEDGRMAENFGPGFANTELPVNPPNRPLPPDRRQLRPQPTNAANRLLPPPTGRPTASDRPVILLKEKRLKATLLIYALRPAK